ncbi:MAG: dihydroorotase [Prevotellaceae bacterium]|jgi:dihydroorotase|nr:dihydroorotase [Prevotellaceae bacterium]
MKNSYLLVGASVYDNSRFRLADIWVEDGRIRQIGGTAPDVEATVINLTGKYIVPGFVDVHVHLREPGYEYKETIATGTAAAASAGYTAVCPMPNLNPAPDTPETMQIQLGRIRETAIIKVYPYASITRGQKGTGELVDFKALSPQVGFSDDGRGVQSEDLMRQAMREAAAHDQIIVAHCEDETLLRNGYIHDGNYALSHHHRGICSESEWTQVARDSILSQETGCRYHVCHVSTKESVAIIRQAKVSGTRISCETAPHYLLLCDDDLQEDGRFKMNPPLRTAADRAALIAAIQDGTIDVIATDHAPHSAEEKAKGLAGSSFGIVGLETAFPTLYTHLVMKGVISLERLIELMCINPRRIFRLDGYLQAGQPADLAVLDLEARYCINPEKFLSKGRSTPFAGWQVQGCNVMTMVNGIIVYNKEQDIQ